MMNGRKYWQMMLAMVVMASLVGCGGPARPKLTRATGTVTYKSKPVVGALVTFLYDDGNSAAGNTDPEGKFGIDAPIGKAKVTVTKVSSQAIASSQVENMTPTEAMAKMFEGKKKEEMEGKDEVPAKYGQPDTSGFTADVVDGGTNDFSFALTD